MTHACPQCDTAMTPREDEYPGEPGITATVQECEKCGFTYLPHKDECILDKKLLQRRNEQIGRLKAEIAHLKRRLGNE